MENAKNISNEEWREKLTPEQFRVLREKGTEKPFTGEYDTKFESGDYVCAACDQKIFSSDYKFDSGCGWPAFDRAEPGSVNLFEDNTYGMHRIEAVCASCGGHLGHVFPDGPSGEVKPNVTFTGDRYCINSVSLKFIPKN
jgi:peptide-methionine (R)-S-oxide reductase